MMGGMLFVVAFGAGAYIIDALMGAGRALRSPRRTGIVSNELGLRRTRGP